MQHWIKAASTYVGFFFFNSQTSMLKVTINTWSKRKIAPSQKIHCMEQNVMPSSALKWEHWYLVVATPLLAHWAGRKSSALCKLPKARSLHKSSFPPSWWLTRTAGKQTKVGHTLFKFSSGLKKLQLRD